LAPWKNPKQDKRRNPGECKAQQIYENVLEWRTLKDNTRDKKKVIHRAGSHSKAQKDNEFSLSIMMYSPQNWNNQPRWRVSLVKSLNSNFNQSFKLKSKFILSLVETQNSCEVYSKLIISLFRVYFEFILSLFLIYSQLILSLFLVYSKFILGLFLVYSKFILSLFGVYSQA